MMRTKTPNHNKGVGAFRLRDSIRHFGHAIYRNKIIYEGEDVSKRMREIDAEADERTACPNKGGRPTKWDMKKNNVK